MAYICYNSVLPSRALSSVTSSIYSKSPPTGTPLAILVTLMPVGLINLLIYIAVVSPSRVELLEEPDHTAWIRQKLLLPCAQISTIHSLCLKTIREHFEVLDLDPSFRLGDEAELKLLKSDVAEDVMETSRIFSAVRGVVSAASPAAVQSA